MKKTILFILLCVASKLCISQAKGNIEKAPIDSIPYNVFSTDFIYGTRLYTDNFYNQLCTLENFRFNAPVQMAGFGYSGAIPVDGRYGSSYWYGHWSYQLVIPQKIIINDTISCNIKGYVLSLDIAGFDLFKRAKTFHVIGSFGFNTGRLRLQGNEWARQKNPFFSPRVSLQPKLRIGNLFFSLRGDYEWDISSVNWRRTLFATKDKIALQRFKQSGATVLFCIGHRFK